jgi:hypothetical protein
LFPFGKLFCATVAMVIHGANTFFQTCSSYVEKRTERSNHGAIQSQPSCLVGGLPRCGNASKPPSTYNLFIAPFFHPSKICFRKLDTSGLRLLALHQYLRNRHADASSAVLCERHGIGFWELALLGREAHDDKVIGWNPVKGFEPWFVVRTWGFRFRAFATAFPALLLISDGTCISSSTVIQLPIMLFDKCT